MGITLAPSTSAKKRPRRKAWPWLTGPIVITGASGHVGGFLRRWLETLPNDVRPVGRQDDYQAAFGGAEAVIHLAGTLQPTRHNAYEQANVATVKRTLEALDPTSTRRVVFLSHVGADPSSRNGLLRTKGEAEDLLRACGCDAVILRSSLIYGPPDDPGPSALPFISREGRSVSVIGTGAQRCAPVYVADVVEALVRAALDLKTPVGTFALAGPDVLTIDEFVDLMNPESVSEHHRNRLAARIVSYLAPSLTPALVDVLSRDSLPDGPRVAEAFGLRPTSVGSAHGRLPVLTY